MAVRMRKLLGHHGDISVEVALRSVLANPRIRPFDKRVLSWLVAMVEAVNGAPADLLNLLEMEPEELRKTNVIPAGGYDELIRDAARGLDIRLNTEVKRIAYGTEGVVAITKKETFSADLAVVAVPLGVLKSGDLQFDPPLSAEKRAAIDRIGFGGRAVLNKIALLFPYRFWPVESEKITTLPVDLEQRGGFEYWVDLESVTGAPILVGFASGSIAAAWDLEAPDEQICQQAHRVLQRMFSSQIPEPQAYRVTRWLSTPFSRGSYSYSAVGSNASDRKCLAEPVAGRLFFTGEATHQTRYATVDGALLAGEREALRIHRRYCCTHEKKESLPWYRASHRWMR